MAAADALLCALEAPYAQAEGNRAVARASHAEVRVARTYGMESAGGRAPLQARERSADLAVRKSPGPCGSVQGVGGIRAEATGGQGKGEWTPQHGDLLHPTADKKTRFPGMGCLDMLSIASTCSGIDTGTGSGTEGHFAGGVEHSYRSDW